MVEEESKGNLSPEPRVSNGAKRQGTSHISHRSLWIGVLLPPIIAAIQMEADYVLVRQACAAHQGIALYAVTGGAALFTFASGLFSLVAWRRFGAAWPGESADVITRGRFIAVLGMMSSGLFLLLILAQGIATLYFHPCQL